jgi:chemotaxis methyl-accepting protein methylase
MLERRIKNRIVKTNTDNVHNYYSFLTTIPDEPKRLTENFMINVSNFFRDPLCFELLARIFIPDLVKEKQKLNDDTLRVWSAGCSQGEEAYSLAILINEFREHEKLDLNLDLFATDYDEKAIESAQNGTYSPGSMKEVKLGLVEKYFVVKDGKYTVIPELKSMVHFSVYDLLQKNSHAPSESIFGDFDLILCRNVLIYFNLDFQEQIINRLHKSLAANGILVLGESEVLLPRHTDKFRPQSTYCKFFKKTGS